MNKEGRYSIFFSGLKEGTHEFNFLVDSKFFEIFEFSEVKEGSVNVQVKLNKNSSLLELNFDINGNISVMCDRCLDDFLLPISYKSTLFVKFGNNFEDIDDNIIQIPYSENEINISQYIYEFINFSIPLKRVHPDNSKGESLCNKEMLDKISQYIKKE